MMTFSWFSFPFLPHGIFFCQVEYDGLTGHVEFNSKGQRTNYTLRILEKHRGGHKEVRLLFFSFFFDTPPSGHRAPPALWREFAGHLCTFQNATVLASCIGVGNLKYSEPLIEKKKKKEHTQGAIEALLTFKVRITMHMSFFFLYEKSIYEKNYSVVCMYINIYIFIYFWYVCRECKMVFLRATKRFWTLKK